MNGTHGDLHAQLQDGPQNDKRHPDRAEKFHDITGTLRGISRSSAMRRGSPHATLCISVDEVRR